MEQYSCRECVELIGLPGDTHGEELENFIVQAFEITGVNVEKRNFHVIHWLGNSKIKPVNTKLTKLVNRREIIKILRNKKKLLELHRSGKKCLEPRKFMSTSPCASIKTVIWQFKTKQIESFCTNNGKIKKIGYKSVDSEWKTEISHAEDFINILGTEIMQEIDAERNSL